MSLLIEKKELDMNNPFEELKEQITTLQSQVQSLDKKIIGEKRWLNVNETAHYLGYSKDHIHKLKNEHFIEGKHYYKKIGRLLFDKIELDNWVTFNNDTLDAQAIADKVLKDLI